MFFLVNNTLLKNIYSYHRVDIIFSAYIQDWLASVCVPKIFQWIITLDLTLVSFVLYSKL